MSEMVERVAAAIKAALPGTRLTQDAYLRQARAAIKALRDPTGPMCEVVLKLDYADATFKLGSYAGPIEWWNAMIDEAQK